MFPKLMTPSDRDQRSIVIAGLTRNPWMPDQVRHDNVAFVRVMMTGKLNNLADFLRQFS